MHNLGSFHNLKIACFLLTLPIFICSNYSHTKRNELSGTLDAMLAAMLPAKQAERICVAEVRRSEGWRSRDRPLEAARPTHVEDAHRCVDAVGIVLGSMGRAGCHTPLCPAVSLAAWDHRRDSTAASCCRHRAGDGMRPQCWDEECRTFGHGAQDGTRCHVAHKRLQTELGGGVRGLTACHGELGQDLRCCHRY